MFSRDILTAAYKVSLVMNFSRIFEVPSALFNKALNSEGFLLPFTEGGIEPSLGVDIVVASAFLIFPFLLSKTLRVLE